MVSGESRLVSIEPAWCGELWAPMEKEIMGPSDPRRRALHPTPPLHPHPHPASPSLANLYLSHTYLVLLSLTIPSLTAPLYRLACGCLRDSVLSNRFVPTLLTATLHEVCMLQQMSTASTSERCVPCERNLAQLPLPTRHSPHAPRCSCQPMPTDTC